MAELPLTPSLVAVIVTEPGATLVTSPLSRTTATAALLVAHVTARPLNAWAAESVNVAVSCNVCPTRRLPGAGLTATAATGAPGAEIGGWASVEPATTLENAPNTAFRFRVPRNATS